MQIKESMLALKKEAGIDINSPWIKVRTIWDTVKEDDYDSITK